MASEIQIRFTEEKYASKTDVMKDLKTSLVDNFWKNILLYRQSFNVKVGLHSFSSNEYVLCNSEMTVAKNESLEKKLLKVMDEMNNVLEEDMAKFEYQNFAYLLRFVSEANGLDNSEVRMRAILKDEIRIFDKDSKMLPRYIDALRYIKRHYNDPINSDFIHTLHKFLTGAVDSYFRTKEDANQANKVLIDRIYTAAPTSLIEPLIKELCFFIERSDLSTLSKAFITYYSICSIKPFLDYSREIALLMLKTVIARESMGETALYMPIEKLLVVDKEEENKVFNDAQKYNDVTYFVRYGYDFLDGVVSEYIDRIISFNADSIHEEYYAPTKEEIKVVEETPKKEEPIPTLVIPKVEKPVPPVRHEEVKKEEEVVEVGEVAIRYVPKGLDEKEANKLETQLLAMDPSLKKKEAHFYAHHCTLGMNYTIQNYKRYCRVSYETARTSMDHLAEIGYYRKEQIKNKFIYSPIKKD